MLRAIDQRDLVRALKGGGGMKAKFLGNMSERVRGFIQAEIDLLDELDPEEVQKVRQSILQQVAALAEEGHVDWPPNAVQQEPYVPAQHLPSDFYDLARHSLDQLGFDQIAALCRELAEQARREGVLSLEQVAAQMEISFFREALILIVDGTETALIQDALKTRSKHGLERRQETRGLIGHCGLAAGQDAGRGGNNRQAGGSVGAVCAEWQQ